jgi:hypothetical protein
MFRQMNGSPNFLNNTAPSIIVPIADEILESAPNCLFFCHKGTKAQSHTKNMLLQLSSL